MDAGNTALGNLKMPSKGIRKESFRSFTELFSPAGGGGGGGGVLEKKEVKKHRAKHQRSTGFLSGFGPDPAFRINQINGLSEGEKRRDEERMLDVMVRT